MLLMNFMNPRLQAVEVGIAATGPDQLVMRAVFDETTAIDRDDPVGATHRRQPVSNDDYSAASWRSLSCSSWMTRSLS